MHGRRLTLALAATTLVAATPGSAVAVSGGAGVLTWQASGFTVNQTGCEQCPIYDYTFGPGTLAGSLRIAGTLYAVRAATGQARGQIAGGEYLALEAFTLSGTAVHGASSRV